MIAVENAVLTPVLDLLGFTKLAKYSSVRIHRQIQTRRAYLLKLEESINNYITKNLSRMSEDEFFKAFNYLHAVEDQMAYVAECSTQLDTNNTINQRPIGNMAYSRTPADHDALFLHTVQPFTPLYKHWQKYMDDYPQKLLDYQYKQYHVSEPGWYDEAATLLMKSTYGTRRSLILARLQWELRTAHANGWYMVFDTVTLAPDMAKYFYENPNAIRDYVRDIGRDVMRAEGKTGIEVTKPHEHCYKYFCCPEYGSKNGRLHFHFIHFCRTLPKGSRDPNECRHQRNRRQIESFRSYWKYGHSMPIALRYHCDAYSRNLRWLWPVNEKGEAIPCRSYKAIGYYVTKYICKNIDTQKADNDKRKQARDIAEATDYLGIDINAYIDNVDLSHVTPEKGVKPCQTMKPLERKLFRVRMSRTLGHASIPVQDLSSTTLLELSNLHYTVTPYSLILRRQCKLELLERVSTRTLDEILRSISEPVNLLKSLRTSMKQQTPLKSKLQSSTPSSMRIMSVTDVSDETRKFLSDHRLLAEQERRDNPSTTSFGAK